MYQLVQINVARMKGVSINNPIMKEFADNLDRVNALAESSHGYLAIKKMNLITQPI